jgi:DNA-binding MurR/RpiR family transcriptional regulator
MAISLPRFITGQNNPKGLAGYIQHHLLGFGQATVASGQTSIAVACAAIAATDLVFVTLATKGTNACVVVSTTIVAGTGFTITVDTDPGTGGAVFNYAVVRPFEY